jgi:hypothetical protein
MVYRNCILIKGASLSMHFTQHAQSYQQKRLNYHVQHSDSYQFFNLLTGPEFFNELEAQLPDHRERLFPPTETLSMFLAQAMNEDRSCQHIVNESAIKRLLVGMPQCSTATGAYCRARNRLPLPLVKSLSCYAGNLISRQSLPKWHWRGRPVRLVDGTTLSMPDTADNQSVYPQLSSQKPGLGFPICRLVGLLCLGSGALLDAATSPLKGKGNDEQSLLRVILESLNQHDVLLGDAYYATYFLYCALQKMGVDAVFEQQGSRRLNTDFRTGVKLGKRDHLMTLTRPKKCPIWMTQDEYDQAPERVIVRELFTGGKILVTTLLCPKATTKKAIHDLYKERWNVELDFRNIKTTLGMDILSCRTAEMVQKEIWVYLLAYNLIRHVMLQSALLADILPRQISFKHSLQIWVLWRQQAEESEAERWQFVLILIAQNKVGNRPGRVEPRAVKRRPKPFPLLTKKRDVARQEIRENGHPKKLK